MNSDECSKSLIFLEQESNPLFPAREAGALLIRPPRPAITRSCALLQVGSP